MAKVAFLLIYAFVPYILTQCTVEKVKPDFKRAMYEFSIELMTRLSQEKENHFVASTLSTWTLLAATSLGAAQDTLEELKQVLHQREHSCSSIKYLQLANSIATTNGTDVVVEKGSAIYVSNNMSILESFREKIDAVGSVRFESLSFENADAAAQRINEYVSQATHEVIEEIVSPSDLDNVILILLDAVFFKGTWKFPFPYEDTHAKPFYSEKGKQIGQTNSMYVREKLKYRAMNKLLSATVVEIPYRDEGRHSMYVFLPHQEVALYTVINKLKLISLKSLQNLFDEFEPSSIGLHLPRFKITSDLNNLKELLKDMGLKAMFDRNMAQFPELSSYPVYVSNFIQKADIEVTEVGTVAAAVTEEEFTFRSMVYHFKVDKPFLFMIVDKELEVPIFVGAYSKPSEY